MALSSLRLAELKQLFDNFDDMPPRGFTNPTPKTESARSALSSFTCTLCNKSYSRQPEYEAHISSYDHQHRKRLQDLKQLSRDPNAAEKARRAERKADAEAGLRVIGTESGGGGAAGVGTGTGTGGSGGFKKGGFKSSFSSVKAPAPVKKNVLGDEDENGSMDMDMDMDMEKDKNKNNKNKETVEKLAKDEESDTDEEYPPGSYYDPQRPTECSATCSGRL